MSQQKIWTLSSEKKNQKTSRCVTENTKIFYFMLGTPLAKQQPWWITLTLTGMADYPGLPEQPLTVMEMPH